MEQANAPSGQDASGPNEKSDGQQPTVTPSQGQDPASGTPAGQNPAGTVPGAVLGQYPAGGVPGQYPAGGVPGQYPAGGVPGQYPAGGVPGQYPPGTVPPGSVPGQYPPGAVQYNPAVVMGQPGQVVYNQPGMPQQIVLMPAPERIPGCPPGLEYLAQLDQLLVHQQVELAEMATNIQFKNKYRIKNSLGQQVYFAQEESDDCMRICCGPARGFVIHITDNLGREVLRLSRIFKCCAGCCWCAQPGSHCSFFIEVESPPGVVIGYVRETMSFASPHFDVRNERDECMLKIRGHWCRCQTVCCQNDINFKIFTNDMKNQASTYDLCKRGSIYVESCFHQAGCGKETTRATLPRTFPRPSSHRLVDIDGKHENISIDRLKPAYLDDCIFPPTPSDPKPPGKAPSSLPTGAPPPTPTTSATPPEPHKTRSGRHVKWPARYVNVFEHG